MNFVSEKIVDMEGIQSKGLPKLVYVLFNCLWSDDMKFPSSWDILFIYFLFIYFLKSILWSDQLIEKLYFYIISFEASPRQHA